MNWDLIEGDWKRARRIVKQRWSKLSNDQLNLVSGRRDHLVSEIQECYGIDRDEADRQVTEWEAQYGDRLEEATRRTGKHAGETRH